MRQADEETALKLAHRAARDAMIDRIPTAERATAVADQDAIHGVVQGLMAAAGREMPAVMPEWYNKVQRDAKRSTDASFQSRGERSAAQPSRVAPPSAPSSLPNKRFDPTINARPELDPKPTLPVTQRPQGKVPKNIEEELAAYHAGEITDPDQTAYLEDIIETRRQQGELFRESEKARIAREKAAARAKTRVNRRKQDTVLPESSDVTVAETPTTPGDTALNEGTDMASKKSTVVDVIAGKPSGKKAGKAAGADIAPDTAAANLDADSGVRGARSAAGDASSTRGQASLVPLTERYTALAEDARNADPSMAVELNERLATLDAEILKLGEKAGTAHFEAAGAAEDAVKRLGAPAAKPAAAAPPVVGTKPAAGRRGRQAAAEPVAPAAEVTAAADEGDKQMEQWGNDIFRRMVTEEWEKARKARGGNTVPKPAAPAPKPEPKPKAALKQETQVGVADDAVGGDGNLDVTAKPRRTRVRTKEQPDTSEMEASRMADEGGMHPVGPNPMTPERASREAWLAKEAELEEAAYQADLARRQRAVRDAEAQKVADEQARRAQYSSQWDEAEEAVDEAHRGRVRRGVEARIAEEGWNGLRVEADRIARAKRGADAVEDGWNSMGSEARRLHNDHLTNENGDMMADMARRLADEYRTRQNGDMMAAMAQQANDVRRARDARLTAQNGDAFEAAAADASQQVQDAADLARTRANLAGAAMAAGGIAAGLATGYDPLRRQTPPTEPPPQVPDTPTETQVGLPDDGPSVTIDGDPEDVSLGAPPPPARRLPPGYRAPQAARYQAPEDEGELVLANPYQDDLALPDPNAGFGLSLPDPNAGRFAAPGPDRATNPDDPRAKLSRLMKALGR
jgi:hypothetical protein